MLSLLLRLDETQYALEVSYVVEVLPLLEINKVVGAPRGVAGTINYRGTFIPIIDLSELLLGRPALAKLSTRVIVVSRSKATEPAQYMGLIAEHATGTMRSDPSAFSSPIISESETLSFGSMTNGPLGLVQRLDMDRLISTAIERLSLVESV